MIAVNEELFRTGVSAVLRQLIASRARESLLIIKLNLAVDGRAHRVNELAIVYWLLRVCVRRTSRSWQSRSIVKPRPCTDDDFSSDESFYFLEGRERENRSRSGINGK